MAPLPAAPPDASTACGDIPPVEYEQEHYYRQAQTGMADASPRPADEN